MNQTPLVEQFEDILFKIHDVSEKVQELGAHLYANFIGLGFIVYLIVGRTVLGWIMPDSREIPGPEDDYVPWKLLTQMTVLFLIFIFYCCKAIGSKSKTEQLTWGWCASVWLIAVLAIHPGLHMNYSVVVSLLLLFASGTLISGLHLRRRATQHAFNLQLNHLLEGLRARRV